VPGELQQLCQLSEVHSAQCTLIQALDPTCHALQYLGDLGCEHVVYKNDEITVEEIAAMNPRGVLVSPGPGPPGSVSCSNCLLTPACLQACLWIPQCFEQN